MAGGVFAFVVLMTILLFTGIGGIAAGIVGIILFNHARKKGKKFGKPLIAVSAVVLAWSVLITALPIGYGVFLYVMNSDVHDEYVETEIVIEENGYQGERFTADGVVYERLEIGGMYPIGEEYFENPIFSYKEERVEDGVLWGNYYELKNDYGFNIVVGNYDEIFCPVDEKEEIIEFFSDENNFTWWSLNKDLESQKEVGADGQKVLDELFEIKNGNNKTVLMKPDDLAGSNDYYFERVTKDNLFAKDQICIRERDGKYYLEKSFVYISDYNGEDLIEGYELSDDMIKRLKEALK